METNRLSMQGLRWYWWRGLSWARAHLYETCFDAYLENPVGVGGLKGLAPAERMRAGSAARAARDLGGRGCLTCYMRFSEARLRLPAVE